MNKINNLNKQVQSTSKLLLIPLLMGVFLSTSVVAKESNPLFAFEKNVFDAQNVTGVVVDEKGETLIGANVLIKGTGKGVVTDLDGKFEIEVPNSATVLVVSYVGYQTKEITVGNQTTLKIVLQSQALLQEVVIVAFGTQKKISVTGAVSSVTTKDLIQSPVAYGRFVCGTRQWRAWQ
jgi:TonB-dependent starch-binding outer membrane protein SusC